MARRLPAVENQRPMLLPGTQAAFGCLPLQHHHEDAAWWRRMMMAAWFLPSATNGRRTYVG